LEQERLEALRYSFDLILIKHQSLGSQWLKYRQIWRLKNY
jgi:hypothetical protein